MSIYIGKFRNSIQIFNNYEEDKQGRRKQMDIGGGGAGKSVNLGRSGGMQPEIILKSTTPKIRFPAFWEVIFYRKAHYKLEIWERADRD